MKQKMEYLNCPYYCHVCFYAARPIIIMLLPRHQISPGCPWPSARGCPQWSWSWSPFSSSLSFADARTGKYTCHYMDCMNEVTAINTSW